MARLVVNPGSPSAWEIQLKPGPNSIGRGGGNDFKIADPSISSAHCQVVVDNLSVMIKDLGSTNGTYVNRAPVLEAPLQPGQTIHLGGVELLYVADAPAGVNVPPPPPPPAVARAQPVAARPGVTARVAGTAVAIAPPPTIAAAPPLAPPIAPPIPASGAQHCRHHPRTLGRYFCSQCQQYFCELCVNSHNVGRETHKFCRACGGECAPVQLPIAQPAAAPAGFFNLACGAFLYPLKGDGMVLLLTGTFFFSLLDAANFFARFAGLFGLAALLILFVLGTGYLTCYLRRIVTSSAMGENTMPDWPDVSDLGSDVLGPFFQLVGTTLVCFLPTIVVSIYVAHDHPEAAWMIIAAAVLGCLYYPMAFLAMAMLDSVLAVNPLVVIPAIMKVPAAYLLMIGLFGAAFAVSWVGDRALHMFIPLRFVSAIISRLLGLYLLIVEMRALGLLYYSHRNRFGWLNR